VGTVQFQRRPADGPPSWAAVPNYIKGLRLLRTQDQNDITRSRVSTVSSFFSPGGGLELLLIPYPALKARRLEIFTCKVRSSWRRVLSDPDSTDSLLVTEVVAVN
jgi:hypothetical protein